MKKYFIIFTLVMAFILPQNSYSLRSKSKRNPRYNCSQRVAKAIKYINKKRYSKVKTILNDVKIQCHGNTVIDTALYYLAVANLKTNLSNEARMELDVLIADFPNTPFRENAYYLLAICNYKESPIYERSQNKTFAAIGAFDDFLSLFPESKLADSARIYTTICKEKLAKKAFMSARFYEKIDRHEAALIYFKAFLKDYSSSKYIPEAFLALARNLYRLQRPSEAEKYLDQLDELNPSSDIISRSELLRKRINAKKKGSRYERKNKRKTDKDNAKALEDLPKKD